MPDLAADVTLRSIIFTLDNPEEFVRRALGQMFTISRRAGPVVLRLGRTGTGRRPTYRFDHAETGAVIAAIDGNTHEPYGSFATTAEPNSWSTETLNMGEVQATLGRVRGVPAFTTPK